MQTFVAIQIVLQKGIPIPNQIDSTRQLQTNALMNADAKICNKVLAKI